MASLETQVVRLGHILESWADNQPDQMGAYMQLKRAKGILFLTTVKGGFFFSGSLGFGLFVKCLGDGELSGPVAVVLAAAGAGMQFGLCKTELVVVLTSSRAVNMFESHGQLRLAAEYGLAVGPAGLHMNAGTSVNRKGWDANGSFSTSMGLFVGVSMEGTLLWTNHWVNHAYYHTTHAGLKNILHGTVPIPEGRRPAVEALAAALRRIQGRLEPTAPGLAFGEDLPWQEQDLQADGHIMPSADDEGGDERADGHVVPSCADDDEEDDDEVART